MVKHSTHNGQIASSSLVRSNMHQLDLVMYTWQIVWFTIYFSLITLLITWFVIAKIISEEKLKGNLTRLYFNRTSMSFDILILEQNWTSSLFNKQFASFYLP